MGEFDKFQWFVNIFPIKFSTLLPYTISIDKICMGVIMHVHVVIVKILPSKMSTCQFPLVKILYHTVHMVQTSHNLNATRVFN